MTSGGEFDERVRQFHEWLDDKRASRQSGRVVGESRAGKTCLAKPTNLNTRQVRIVVT